MLTKLMIALCMVFVLAVGLLIGYIIRKNVGEKAIGSAETKARNLILDAENRAETIKKEMEHEYEETQHTDSML